MEQWITYKLGKIAECSLGKMLDQRKNKGKPQMYLGNIAVRWGSFNINPSQTMLFEDHELTKYKLEINDIVICEGGEPGRCAMWKSKDTIYIQKALHRVRVNRNIADPFYVYYYITYLVKSHLLDSYFTGTTIKHLPREQLLSIDIKMPNLATQKKIGNILETIDSKIDLNRRINDNLEQQAQALFKSWFVDFEPFKDGKFVESEIGMIPEGWKVGKLEDIADVVGGGTPSKANALYFDKQCIPWITPKDLSIKKTKFISKGEIDITEEGYKNSSAKKIPLGSVLFSSRAPIGYISIAENELTTNQGFKSVVPVKAGTSFLYLYLKANTKAIEAQATGSTFKEASGSLMKSLCVIIPPDTVFDSFERNAFPFFSAQANVEREIVNLSKARDTLLPRLMSGELKINDLNC